MSRVRLEECERNITFMPSSKARNFFEKIKKGPKIHYFAHKSYTGTSKLYSRAPKTWGSGGPGAPLDLLVLYNGGLVNLFQLSFKVPFKCFISPLVIITWIRPHNGCLTMLITGLKQLNP